MTNTKELERFVNAYNEYCAEEFGDDAITVEEALEKNELGVMFTTSIWVEEFNLRDDAFELQASYFLDKKTLEYFIDDVLVKVERFNDYAQMAEDIENAEFCAYLYIVEDELEELLKLGIIKTDDDGYPEWTTKSILEESK